MVHDARRYYFVTGFDADIGAGVDILRVSLYDIHTFFDTGIQGGISMLRPVSL